MDQLEADRHRVDLADWQTFSRAIVKGTAVGLGGLAVGSAGAGIGAGACSLTVVLIPAVPVCAAVAGLAGGLLGGNWGRDGADFVNSRYLSDTWVPKHFLPQKPSD
jgi:hypothetical protein